MTTFELSFTVKISLVDEKPSSIKVIVLVSNWAEAYDRFFVEADRLTCNYMNAFPNYKVTVDPVGINKIL